MKILNSAQTKQVSGAGRPDGYWQNDNWDYSQHNDWANQWHDAGRDAWNNRGDRDYPWNRT